MGGDGYEAGMTNRTRLGSSKPNPAKRITVIKQMVIWGCLVGIMTGCEGPHLLERKRGPDEEVFARLWSTYRLCRASQDLQTVLLYEERLAHVESIGVESSPSPQPLLSRFMATQPVRTVADPRAMAADCTLWGARVAFEAGQVTTAIELFHSVLARYPEPDYAYYSDQAGRGLADLFHVSTTTAWARTVSPPERRQSVGPWRR
jgi:hypothetical protein